MFSNRQIEISALALILGLGVAVGYAFIGTNRSLQVPDKDQALIGIILDDMFEYCLGEQPIDFDLSKVKMTVADAATFSLPYKADGSSATVFVPDKVTCTNINFFGGSGGSTSYIIADGKIFETWGGTPFSVEIGRRDNPIILVPRSGRSCEYDEDINLSNADPCYSVAVWNDFKQDFSSVDGVIKLSSFNP